MISVPLEQTVGLLPNEEKIVGYTNTKQRNDTKQSEKRGAILENDPKK
jgi:hypothetical protein